MLRGSCLGESRADVVQVLVAGVDCTSNLEYFSPCESTQLMQIARITYAISHAAKLAVVTVPRAAPGSGPVVIQTLSGGVGVSWINFTFVEEGKADSPLQGRRRNKNGGNESLPVTYPPYI